MKGVNKNAAIATLVIGGYLGAGKTTLVNDMLRHANGQRIAVLVNDFGDINIDADLIQGQSGDILELSGGCVCCSFGADLVGSLMTVSQRQPAPDLVLIETSGVALPGAVARSARLVPALNVLGVLTVLDALTVVAQAQDRYVGGTVMQQIQDAHLLLLNKVDLPAPGDLAKTRSWLASLKTSASVIEVSQASLPADFWLSLESRVDPPRRGLQNGGRMVPVPPVWADAAANFESRSWQMDAAVDVQALIDELSAQPQVLRAKGRLRDAAGVLWVLQKVGSLCTVIPAESTDADTAVGQLVVITLRGDMPAALFSQGSESPQV